MYFSSKSMKFQKIYIKRVFFRTVSTEFSNEPRKTSVIKLILLKAAWQKKKIITLIFSLVSNKQTEKPIKEPKHFNPHRVWKIRTYCSKDTGRKVVFIFNCCIRNYAGIQETLFNLLHLMTKNIFHSITYHKMLNQAERDTFLLLVHNVEPVQGHVRLLPVFLFCFYGCCQFVCKIWP